MEKITDESIADLDRAIELDPNNGELYYQRGIAKGQTGDYIEAIVDLDKAIEIIPNHKDLYYSIGKAKYDSGDINGACKDWKKASELGNKDAENRLLIHCK